MSSAPIGTKPGRPRDPVLAMYRALFPEWSERTVARYARAHRLAKAAGFGNDDFLRVVRSTTRANGTISVHALEAQIESAAFMAALNAGQSRDTSGPVPEDSPGTPGQHPFIGVSRCPAVPWARYE